MSETKNTQTSIEIQEPCGFDWHNHWLRLPCPEGQQRLTVQKTGAEVTAQRLPGGLALCRVSLPANAKLQLVWQHGQPKEVKEEVHVANTSDMLVLDNGIVEVRLNKTIAGGHNTSGPFDGIRPSGKAWTGKSRINSTVISGNTRLLYAGSLAACCSAEIELTDGGKYHVEFELLAGESFLHVKETMQNSGNASIEFDFSEYSDELLVVSGLPGSPAGRHKPSNYSAPFGVKPDNLVSLGSQCICGQIGSPWFMLSNSCTAVGVIVCRGGDWMYPGDNTLHLVRRENGIKLEGETKHGSREWLMVAGNADEWIPAKGESANALAELKTRICDMPLERVRHWVLDIDDNSVEPNLWTDLSGLNHAMQKLAAPEWDKLLTSIERPVIEQREYAEDECRCWGLNGTTDSFPSGIYWLKTQEPKYAEELAKQITDWTVKRAKGFAKYGLTGGGGLDYVALRPLKHCLYWYDLLRGTSYLISVDEKSLRRALIFCAYCTFEKDYFDWESAYVPAWSEHSLRRFLLEEDYSDTIGCQNFHSDVFSFTGMTGLAFPEHQMAVTWINHAEQMALTNLEYFVTNDGTYVESDNYYQHFLGLLYYLGVALHRAGHPAILEHPRMKAGLEHWIHAQTPPLTHTGSSQTAWFGTYSATPQLRPISQMINVGDTGLNWGGQALPSFLHHAANHYSAIDPVFAGWLEWAWLRGASPLATYNFIIQELLVQELAGPRPETYPLRSEIFMGHGIMMRNKVGKPKETGVFVRTGRATSHMHFDGGGLLIWHAGVPLVVDPGYVHDEFTPIRQYGGASWKHSTVTFDIPGLVNPFNGYLGMEHMQDPLAVRLNDDYDYVECDLSQNNVRSGSWRGIYRIVSIEHYRQVLFAKRRNYIVVKDRIYRSIYPSLWHLHVMGDKEEINGNTVRVHGRYGVDLMVTFVQASCPEIRTEQLSSVRHISVRQEPERDYLVVLQPICSGEEAYQISPVWNGVAVEGKGWTERVILNPLPGVANAGEWYASQHEQKEGKYHYAKFAVVRNGKTKVIHE